MMSSDLKGNNTLPRNLNTIYMYNPTGHHNLADSLHEAIQSFGRTCNLHAARNILQPSHHFFNFLHQQYKRGYNVYF
jgi:hypothetical protein